MGYLGELRANWRPMLGAVLGLATGYSLSSYIVSMMAPHMLKEFGWTPAEFAYVSTLGLISVVMLPIVGRLTDMIGVRRTAMIGVIVLPMIFLALSFQNGDLRVYMALFLVQASLCITTTMTVYSRVVVQYIEKARGLALALVASGPPLVGLAGVHILEQFVADHGWRAGYQALAAFTLACGIIALLMIREKKSTAAEAAAKPKRRALEDYPTIIAMPAFWVLLFALLLVNLPNTIVLFNLALLMKANGMTDSLAATMLQAFFIGQLAGRLISGLALDRFPSHLVATFSMLLPSAGLWMIASSMDTTPVLAVSVLLIGLAFGAEGDIIGYLVVRNFGVGIYSSVMGLMTAATSISTNIGGIALGLTLDLTGNYDLFMMISGATVFVGSLLFLLLPLANRKAPQPA